MPVTRYYTVTQTRVVKVRANTVLQAAVIADAAFDGGVVPPESGPDGASVTQPVKIIDLHVSEDAR